MPWQNVRKWLEDEVEEKEGKQEKKISLARELQAQIKTSKEPVKPVSTSTPEDDASKLVDIGMASNHREDNMEETITEEDTGLNDQNDPAEIIGQDVAKEAVAEEIEAVEETANAPTGAYSIEHAIELMRGLPEDHIELVALVVKRTLESARVHVSSIISDASSKQKQIDERIRLLQDEIHHFEEEISHRSSEIETLGHEVEEITTVKERLKLAEQLAIKEASANNKPATLKRVVAKKIKD